MENYRVNENPEKIIKRQQVDRDYTVSAFVTEFDTKRAKRVENLRFQATAT